MQVFTWASLYPFLVISAITSANLTSSFFRVLEAKDTGETCMGKRRQCQEKSQKLEKAYSA